MAWGLRVGVASGTRSLAALGGGGAYFWEDGSGLIILEGL